MLNEFVEVKRIVSQKNETGTNLIDIRMRFQTIVFDNLFDQLIYNYSKTSYYKISSAQINYYCDMIKSKTIQFDTSISQIFFAIAPFQISFGTFLEQTLIIYLQKGLQIIGSLKYPLLPSNQNKIAIPFNDNLLQFRIYFDKNTQYQWSIYKRLEDDSQQLIETQKFSLKDIWKTVSQNRNSEQNKQRSFTETLQFSYLKMNLSFYVFAAQSQLLISEEIMMKLNPEAYQNSSQKANQSTNKRIAKRSSLIKTDSIKSDKKNAKSNIQPLQKVKEMKQNKSTKSLFVEKQILQEKYFSQANQDKLTREIQYKKTIQKNAQFIQQPIQIKEESQPLEEVPVQSQVDIKKQAAQNLQYVQKEQESKANIVKQKQGGGTKQKNQPQEIQPQQNLTNRQQPVIANQNQNQNKLFQQEDHPNTFQKQQSRIISQSNSQVLQTKSKKIAIIFLIIFIIIGFGGYQFLPTSLKKKQLKGVSKFKKNKK